ncbi:MAG: HAMP domain-containing sensor histidine kinase, partial [Bacteriovorax sp.]|nr:HAMP domain-containing sensor histidine kinase [Bacteriovorax sp.]
MEVLNLAVVALFESLERNQIDRNLLIEGTQLKIETLSKLKEKHSWDDFVKMYDNCARLLGPDKTAREIGYQGIYNENISVIRKIGTGLFDSKTIYWYIATFVAKHLYANNVTFKYTKIKSNHVVMEINIRPELKDCPLLLNTYTYLFENIPTVLGLSKAKVTTRISERRAEYNIYLGHTFFFKQLYSRLWNFIGGYNSSIVLMAELENQSIELSKLIEEKSQLLRILSHDISNQASVIDFYLKKVLNKGEITTEDQRLLNIAKNSSNRLSDILKNVQNLEISYIKGVTLAPVNLDSIFLSLVDNFRPQLSNKNIILRCNNELPFNVTAMADAKSLEINVLGNLISNAIKFSKEGSLIILEAKMFKDKVLITIADQGIGLS